MTVGIAATCLALQADGKIVVGGTASIPGSHCALMRLDPSGALDTSFGVGGFVWTDVGGFYGDRIEALLVQPDGKIVASGSVGTRRGVDFLLLRYTDTCGLDPAFGSFGVQITLVGPADDAAYDLGLQPDGKLVAAGSADLGTRAFALARYAANGALDTGFGSGGVTLSDPGPLDDGIAALALQPLGQILVAGRVGNDVGLARYWP
jgi:uncharacterized delta-60 repeat protein